MAASSRHPNQVLIMVNVTFPLGQPVYTYRSFSNGSDITTAPVAPGDQIGWVVRVQAGFNWSQPAYNLTFANPSILGTGSISVPNGGPSGFFTVQALSGSTKYTLSASGIVPVSDPQIVVDPNGTLGQLRAGPQFNVRWTAASNAMELSVGGNPWVPFPLAGLQVAFNDKVQFFAVLTPPADFEIDFSPILNPDHAWESPFDPETSQFPTVNHGANENTANLAVIDKSDPAGTAFKFMASLTDGSVQSAAYMLILS